MKANPETPEADDAALLRRYVQCGDEHAFRDLVQRHLGLVHSAVLRGLNGDIHRAEEVTQSVFVELARKSRTLVMHPVLPGWLYTTACRMAAVQRRRQSRLQRHEHLMPHPPEPAPDAEPDWDALRPILDDAMMNLPDQDRNLILLRFFEHRSYGFLGTAGGLSEDAARMRVARALDRLRMVLARRGVKSSAAALAGTLTASATTSPPAALVQTIALTALEAGRGLRAVPWKTGWIATHGKAWILGSATLALLTMAIRSGQARRPVEVSPVPSTANLADTRTAGSPARPLIRASRSAGTDRKTDEALAALRSALFDTWRSAETRGALVQESAGRLVGSEATALPVLREALESGQPAVIAAAVGALGRFGPLPGMLHAELLEVFRSTDSPELAGLTANRLLAGTQLAEDVPELLRLLKERPVVREALLWLIPDAIARTNGDRELWRLELQALLENGDPELRAAAGRILVEFPDIPPSQVELGRSIATRLVSGELQSVQAALVEARHLQVLSPDLMGSVQRVAESHSSPEIQLAARQVLRRIQTEPASPTGGSIGSAVAPKDSPALQRALRDLAGEAATARPAIQALKSVPPRFWREHPTDRSSALRMLDNLLQDPDPTLVETAADALSRIRGEAAKPVFTWDELEPLFQAMERSLSPGEYAIAMRDLRTSLEMYWQAVGGGSGTTTLVPMMLVQGLPVGPMHENPAAYQAMIAALRRIDPRIPVPTPKP